VNAWQFVHHRRSARKVHGAALAERGLMRREQKTALFIPYDTYVPDSAAREVLLDEIRAAARGECKPDQRLVVLASLMHATMLAWSLGLDRAERKGLKEISKDEPLGKVVRYVVNMYSAAAA
jgi:hypothetical protein